MTHNKGSRYITCKECNRKRYCKESRPRQFWRGWTCSKGHYWELEYGNEAKVIAIELENIIPKIRELFERDDIFFKALKRR